MEFMGKKLENLVVTLPFEDGTTVDYGVYSYFEVNHKNYFALLPLKGKKLCAELSYVSLTYCNESVIVTLLIIKGGNL